VVDFTSCQYNEEYSLQQERNLGLQFMECKKTFLSEHYVYSCNLSLQFRNTSFDKLAFGRRERVGRIIRPALLKTR